MVQAITNEYIKREQSDPTSEYDLVLLEYDLGEFTISSNSSTLFELEYPKNYDRKPRVNINYNFGDTTGDSYNIVPRNTDFSTDHLDVTFMNMRSQKVTVTAQVICTLTVPKKD